MVLANFALATLLASLASAAPLSDNGITRIPVTKNAIPFSFSSLVKERVRVASLAKGGSAVATNEGGYPACTLAVSRPTNFVGNYTDVTYIVKPTIGNETYDLILVCD